MDDLVRVHRLHAARDARKQRDDSGVRGEAALAHRVVQRAPGRKSHHEARRLLDARPVQPHHIRVAHTRERTHLAAHGLCDPAQRRLARLAVVTTALLLDRDGQPLRREVAR